MQVAHLPHNLNTLYLPKKDLMHLFWGGVVRRMAIILLGLFSAIYVYETFVGLGLTSQLALILVLSFFVIEQATRLVALIFAENLSQKIGFKGTIWASSIPFFLFIPAMILAKGNPFLFFFAAIFYGMQSSLYWWGYHGYFIKRGDTEHFGLSISEAGFLETFAAVATPFFGAVIVSLLGFPLLYFLTGALVVIALFLVGRGDEERQRHDVTFGGVLILIRRLKSISLAYVGSGGEGMLYVTLWPLLLYFIFGQLVSMGEIVSLSVLVSSLFSLAVGQWVDKQGVRSVIRIGTPLVFISWLIKGLNRSFSAFVFADSFWNFGERMVVYPLNALTYKKALEGKSTAKAILFREVNIIFGSFFAISLVMFFILLGFSLTSFIIIASVFSLMPLIAYYKRRI